MVWLLRRCERCEGYTLREDSCPQCGGPVKIPHPPKFSMDDRYRKYRIQMRRMARREQEEPATG